MSICTFAMNYLDECIQRPDTKAHPRLDMTDIGGEAQPPAHGLVTAAILSHVASYLGNRRAAAHPANAVANS